MDDFTVRHLAAYAIDACHSDERAAFVCWVALMDPDDLAYYETAGWPAALNRFRNERTNA